MNKFKYIYIYCHVFDSKKAIGIHLLVLFVSLFLFLALYNPFNLIKQPGNGITTAVTVSFAFSFIFFLIATAVMYIFRMKIRKKIFMLHDYIFMILLNLFIAAVIFSIGSSTILEYLETLLLIGAIIVVPYLLTTAVSFILYLVKELIDKRDKLLAVKAEVAAVSKKEMIEFIDEYGKLSFYLDKDSILYVEANDNYINIYFYANFRVSYKILRASMKSVEEMLSAYSVVRCHRSYMVNINKINYTQKEKGKLKLSLTEGDFLVPVSNSFAPKMQGLPGFSPLDT